MIICLKDINNWSVLLWPEFHAIISKHRERRGQFSSVAIKVQQLLEKQTKFSRETDAMRLPHLHNLQCKSEVMRQQHLSLGLGSRRALWSPFPSGRGCLRLRQRASLGRARLQAHWCSRLA